MRKFCKALFPVVDYAYTCIPTYPTGQIGFMLCGKNPVSVLVILHLSFAQQSNATVYIVLVFSNVYEMTQAAHFFFLY